MAETERGRGGAVLVDVSSDIKRRGKGERVGCNYTGLLLQTGVGGVGGCRGVVTENWRTSKAACQIKQWLPPHIAVQSMAKQILSAVQNRTGNRGRHAQLIREEPKSRLNQGTCICYKWYTQYRPSLYNFQNWNFSLSVQVFGFFLFCSSTPMMLHFFFSPAPPPVAPLMMHPLGFDSAPWMDSPENHGGEHFNYVIWGLRC